MANGFASIRQGDSLTIEAVMNIRGAWKLITAAVVLAMLAVAPRAIADDINPDADVPDLGTLTDSSPPNQVLEIPQHCDQDAVAVLCDRSTDSAMSSDSDANLPNDADVGSISDYNNQNIATEMSGAGTMNVPVGLYPPTILAPAPVIVSSGVRGPGSYQQWARGPGSYQSMTMGPAMTMGPGYIQPMPLGYRPGLGANFGALRFSPMNAARFGRR